MRSKMLMITLAAVGAVTAIQALYLKALPGSAVRVYATSSMQEFNQPPDESMTVTFDGYVFDYHLQPGITDGERAAIKDRLSGVGQEDMTALLAVAHWVRDTMCFGGADRASEMGDGHHPLQESESTDRQGLCDRYARLFATACQGLGIPARIVELNGHVVPEAFLRESGRWVMVDPTLGYYLTQDGIPLSVVEIIRAYRGDNPPHPAVFAEARGDDSLYVPEEEETLRGIYLNGFTVVSNQHLHPLRLVSTVVQTFDLPIAKVQYREGNSPGLGRHESLLRATLSLTVIITLVIAVLVLMGARRQTPAP